MKEIVTCLWFDGDAEEAAKFYTSILPDSKIQRVTQSPADTHAQKAGDVITVEFTLLGKPYMGLNGGPDYPFTEAVSFQIMCEDQAEVDRMWSELSKGGSEVACGWLKDRWGLCWQIVPVRMIELLNDPDRERAKRAQEAMMKMVKLDIATLEAAADNKE
ncbi:VOC family protein [Oceaniferula spumae]|uniref:VOC family protein n=1 Tax=Oceaniferula spumae TaxID=2979115 RepID=A0AAT9FJQ8_9BACT